MKKMINKVSPSPFCFCSLSVRVISMVYIAVLSPQIILLGILRDFSAVLVILTSVVSCILAECIENHCRGRSTIKDGSACLCGLFIGFFCPDTMPLLTVFCCSLFAMFAARCVFGGHGSCWLNASMAAIAMLYLSSPANFPAMLVTPESMESAGASFIASSAVPPAAYDPHITGLLNSSFLKNFGIRIPEGYATLFFDAAEIIPAFRFNILTLIASVVLISFNIIDWLVPALFIVVYALFVRLFAMIPFSGIFASGDILFALLTGGTFFTAFFILADSSLLPVCRITRCIYAVIAAALAFLIAGPGGTPVGMIFTALIMNAFSPVMIRIEGILLERRQVRISQWRSYESK